MDTVDLHDAYTVRSLDDLAKIYAKPLPKIANKATDHITDVGRAFIAVSPFLVLATSLCWRRRKRSTNSRWRTSWLSPRSLTPLTCRSIRATLEGRRGWRRKRTHPWPTSPSPNWRI
jgi:hypothetical protein